METCASCRFYKPHNMQRHDGYCRRHAPSPVVNQQNMKDQVLQLAEWPTVSGDNWCGEFKPKDVTVSTTPERKP